MHAGFNNVKDSESHKINLQTPRALVEDHSKVLSNRSSKKPSDKS